MFLLVSMPGRSKKVEFKYWDVLTLNKYWDVLITDFLFLAWLSSLLIVSYVELCSKHTTNTTTITTNNNNNKVKKNAIYYDKTQHGKFRGRPLFEATKQHLNTHKTTLKQQLNVEKWDVGHISALGSAVWFCCFGECFGRIVKLSQHLFVFRWRAFRFGME